MPLQSVERGDDQGLSRGLEELRTAHTEIYAQTPADPLAALALPELALRALRDASHRRVD